jgi:diaminohydroxyphosphoribosylaminopyrimidine deaminase/5-amino-6-(5-phosphoribosylamino)uracil reductase
MNLLDAKSLLDLAARLALRGSGRVEPNPLVGAVVVKEGAIIGRGHHHRFGGLHAETQAIADCRARGHDLRGSTVYVTLEPCNHFGRQPPCSKALIEAGVARVIVARADPNPVSTGGAEALRRAGVEVEFTEVSPLAIRVSDPFIKRITTGLPWVIAKWAQTHDGRLVTRPDEPRWISNRFSRRRVHRLRGRVDAVITGVGTVLADDPRLTVRDVPSRRLPMRVILDSNVRTPLESVLVRTVAEAPVMVCVGRNGACTRPGAVKALREAGAVVEVLDSQPDGGLHLPSMLARLASVGVHTALLEAGPRLTGSFVKGQMADELVVYVGAVPASFAAPTYAGYRLVRSRTLAGDLELLYWRDASQVVTT